MSINAIPVNEADRIAALRQLHILDTPPEEDFDDIVTLAAQICEVPISAISFEDTDRYWLKAKWGLDDTELPRRNSLCTYSVTENGISIITDTLEDSRLTDHPFVKGKESIRFFCGIRLVNEEGYFLGYLCVMDRVPRTLTEKQKEGLQILAKQVVILLKLRLQILKLKEAEERSRSTEEQMDSIFRNAIDAVVMTDANDKILQWNPKAESIFGWKATEAIGRYFHETVVPERYRAEHLKRMKEYATSVDNLSLNRTIEIKALRKDNTELDIALGVSPAEINGQRFFIVFVSDITDRIEATKRLDDQKAFYENILNKLPTDIAVFSPEHKYLFVNPGAIKDEELRKYIVGKDDFEYAEFRGRDKSVAQIRREQFMQIKNSGKEIRWEDTIRDPEGNPKTSLRRLFPVHDENGELTLVIGFGIDITDRKIMEEKQEAMLKQLSTQNTQLIDFCNIVSHNLRAPLVNMSMLVNFIQETEDEEEQKMLISKLQPVIEHLHNTFNELVESIQIKQDLEVKSEQNDMAACLENTIDGLKMEINKSEAVIVSDFGEAATVYCPSKYLYSIMHNLVSNALKYQLPKRKPDIRVETKRNGESIILSVKDNGLGLDMNKHRENMFKIGKVFHYHPNAKGFGLFMTKTQVEAMGGNIWVDSEPDKGSTFFIEFKKQIN